MSQLAHLDRILTRLDRISFRGALAAGLVLGGAVGVAAVAAGTYGLWAVGVLGLVCVVVALTAEPIWVDEPDVEPVPPEPADILDMESIAAGTFLMGSPENEPGRDDRERQHEVTVSSFVMGRTTVTRKQYREIMELDDAPGPGGDEHPVTDVSWFDAVAFCNRASEKAGFEPCYVIDGKNVEWVDGNGYRLPTEAEWEYAARAGTTTRWSFGDEEARLGDYAWFEGNSGNQTHPVATRKPNPWDLFDMHGNVWEWCWNYFQAEYPEGPTADPRGPATAAPFRVLRGGAYWFEPRRLRSAFRGRGGPEGRSRFIGFRCVRSPRRQP